MALFYWRRWLRSISQARPKTYRKKHAGGARPALEALEDRALFAVLPPALVSNAGTIATSTLSGFSPNVALDPVNPLKMIEVHTTGSLLVANYSTDGGQSWTTFINPVPASPGLRNLPDPTLNPPPPPNPPVRFSTVTNPTVAIDRAENVYIVDAEHNAANTVGALVLQRWRFTGGGPVAVASDVVVQRWTNADPILNPVVAVDNNLPSFTDPLTGAAQTDTLAVLSNDPNNAGLQVPKALYVAWNTDNRPPSTPPGGTFDPNVIMVAGSADGGAHWTTPQLVIDGGHTPPRDPLNPHFAAPQIVFTQGSADGRVAGG